MVAVACSWVRICAGGAEHKKEPKWCPIPMQRWPRQTGSVV